MATHLTNQFVQKKDPTYFTNKEDTIWSVEQFNNYFNTKLAGKYNLAPDWVYEVLMKNIKNITKHCFDAVKNKLHQRLGFFELFGLDFLVDDDLKHVYNVPCVEEPCSRNIERNYRFIH